MKGFAEHFADLPDYILGITYQIWEGREWDRLNDYYAPNIVVRSPSSIVVGNTKVIAATKETLREFPDRCLLGEDVIWSGSPETGFLSSHRIFSTATHAQGGLYGEATGARFRYRIIADCHAIENQIDDEWLVRDQGAIVRQMGMDPKAYARDLIQREGGPENAVRPLTPATDLPGPYTGRGNDHVWGQRFAACLRALMTGEAGVVPAHYDRAVQIEMPGGQSGNGLSDVERFWFGLRTAFPSATFTIHHQIGRDDPQMPPRSAIRWSLYGTHDGPGLFGPPSGADVYIMGISHAEFGSLGKAPANVRREWTLFDETAIWKQILLQKGDL